MDSLANRYKLEASAGKPDLDEKIREIGQLLDLKANTKVAPDWHSTRAFQVFLEALDVNSNRVSTSTLNELDRSKGNTSRVQQQQSGLKKIGLQERSLSNNPENKCNDIISIDKNSANDKNKLTTAVKQINKDETILSAEALKILSELPDLSHMSARSFMFPTAVTSKSSKS